MTDKKIGIYFVTILILAFSLINIVTMITLTGKAIDSTQGQASICMNNPPVLPTISTQRGHFNTQFNLHINGTDYQTLTYSDNVSVFTINATTGMINFTPFRTDVASHHILITTDDNANGCPLSETTSFIFNINNSLPAFSGNIQNESWEEDVWLLPFDLDTYFSDPDVDQLNYTYIITDYESDALGGLINVSINNLPNNTNRGKVTFKPRKNWYGVAYVQFIANDSVNSTYSNNVTLNSLTIQNHTKLHFKLNLTLSETGSILYSLNNQSNKTTCTSCTATQSYINITQFGIHNLSVYGIDTSNNIRVSFLTLNISLDSDGDWIPDVDETDTDNDGITDSIDPIIGNKSNVFTNNIPNLYLKIDGSENV